MQAHDKERFLAVFVVLDEFYNKISTKETLRIYWADLAEFSIEQIEHGAMLHRKDPEKCAFFPKSGDLIRQINNIANQDGRLDWAEAFASCIAAASENRTVVWADEMRDAWFSVCELYELDKIAAKQSFKSIYERLVSDARARRVAVRYSVSLGGSESHQREMIERAIQQGHLSQIAAHRAFPALIAPVASNVVMLPSRATSAVSNDEIKKRLAELRAALECKKEEGVKK